MKLYFTHGSPFARKVRIVLAEKGLPYEADVVEGVRPVDAMPGPTLAIPVLEDHGMRLWESDLIVEYLLRTYPDRADATAEPPLSPWLTRPEQEWQDRTTLATIATCAATMVNLRFMLVDGITPENSDYLARQRARFDRCMDWLEERVTPEGFAPGWFSIMDIGFICPMVYCEVRQVMAWRGRPKLESLYQRYQDRASMQATQINVLAPLQPNYLVHRTRISC